jgi:M6 family metalloprotease-like protein
MNYGIATRRMVTALLVAMAAFSLPLLAAPLKNVPQRLVQPDGTAVSCFASGDEFYHWLHDANGFTIVQDEATGDWVYACAEGGELLPTALMAGKSDPGAAGLKPGPLLSPERYRAIREAWPGGCAARSQEIRMAPHTGVLNSVTILIRFSDEPEFTDTVAYYDSMFNDPSAGKNSMRNYFMEASYGKLEILSHFYPVPPGATVVSYQDSHPRNYFKKKSATNPEGYSNTSQSTTREWTLLKAAVEAVASQIPADLVIDGDNDGFVDSTSFVVSGGPEGWSELLWPHMWSLGSGYRPVVNGKTVWTYDFQLRDMLENGVLCHEMFHVLGAPDLYHYSYDGLQPTGNWDIMENTSNPPQHMGAFMKFRYGHWIDAIPEISSPGTYTLNPLTSPEGQCFKIPCPASTQDEYFVVEFRKKQGTFESRVPISGLLVYRINGYRDGQGNRNGPPDEVYIYRPGGSPDGNGSPSAAAFSVDYCRTALTDTTSATTDFLTDGTLGGLVLSHVETATGDTITFQLGNPQTCVITCTSTPSKTSGTAPLSVNFNASDRSCDCESSPDYSWEFGDGSSTQDDYPTHTYTAPGIYTYTLTALGDGGASCTSQGTITVTAACQLDCSAQATPGSGTVPLPVTFTATASGEGCGAASYAWTFGDGASSTEQNPSHTYSSAGTFSWAVTVSAGGQTCSKAGSVSVTPPPCSLSCTALATPASGPAPLAVLFQASVTATDCSGSADIQWTFGDGASSAQANPSHTYTSSGNYTWTLTVTQDGETCTQTGSVAAGAQPIPGDCDGDGAVSIGEVQKAINMFLGTLAPACGVDCNGDGTISIGEVQKVINNFLGNPAAC